jgi:ATP-dependent Zn protease
MTSPLFAQSDSPPGSNVALKNAVVSFLPIALFLGIIYFFFRRQTKSPLVKLQVQNVERHIEHMQRLEDLLERIARALEDRNQR